MLALGAASTDAVTGTTAGGEDAPGTARGPPRPTTAAVAIPPPMAIPPMATHAHDARRGGGGFSRSAATETLVCGGRSASSTRVGASRGATALLLSIAAISRARASRRSPARSRSHCPTALVVAGGVAASMASAIAWAVSNRSAGSFDRPRMTTASSAGGIPSAYLLGGSTTPSMMRRRTLPSLSAENSRCPASASQRTTAAANTSLRRVTG